jgi:hypothetical protein
MATNADARRYLVAFATGTPHGIRVEVHLLAEPASPAPTRVIVTQGYELPNTDAPSIRRAA